MSTISAEIEERRARAKAWFESLRDRICAELERIEDEAPYELFPGESGQFDLRPWARGGGAGGGVGGFLAGRFFEKAGVHTSAANGRFTPEMALTMPGAEADPTYVSASISLIIHPLSPRVPAVHMNTRFLSTGVSWFGGGADLTPLIDEQRSQDAADARPSTRPCAPPATPTTRNAYAQVQGLSATSTSSCRIARSRAGSAASSTTS